MGKIDLTSNEWVDMVFEGRNQAYGAYQLRKGTSKRNIMAIIIMLVVAAIIATLIGINTIIENSKEKVAVTTVATVTSLKDTEKKPEVKQKRIEVEPKQVVEKVKSSVKFVAPVIRDDNKVRPEDEMRSQDELLKTNTAIGNFDVKGNDDANGQVLKATQTITQPEPPKQDAPEKIFDVVEQMPAFPGGDAQLLKYLKDNVKYPVIAMENGIQGRVVIGFVVEKDGHVSDVRVIKSVDPSLDREAERVIKSMPNWIPGKQNGTSVRVKYQLPVLFRLQNQ